MHKQMENLSMEQMREILEGAPDWPVIGYCIVGNNYIFKQCEHAPCSYSNLDNAWSEEYAIHFVGLNDRRTAISEHDEFKVGDLVVHPKFDNKKIYEIIKIKGDLFTVFYDRNSHSFRSDLRHATPEEIKAGHRLEAERHG